MIAGAGGNNSWFLNEINRLIIKDQLPTGIEFTIYDGDDVEKKNLLYQDFETADVLENKAKVLSIRYAMHAKQRYIKDAKEFDNYDIVISGVDNRDFRALLFEYMNDHPEKYWIDLRAEGRTVALYTKHKTNTLDKLLSTLPPKGTKSASCQLKYELDNGIIQLGNKIAAMIAAQWLLNHLRGEQNPPDFIHMF
ncbi:MAG TPA: ThiF family adenylyltransferase [Nitrosomonas sp.]|nr:ThiF family adenylyltransferase [Nitrosomonas sp.]